MTFVFGFAGCSSSKDNSDITTENVFSDENTFNTETDEYAENTETSDTTENTDYLVKFTMENGESFIIELYPEYAPKTCENFIDLVSDGFYDGLTFHRVIDNFMAQGGDPEGNGLGGSGKTIKGEFARNKFKQNTLSHTRGIVSMARSDDFNSASSQFFICYVDATYLDGDYAAFGEVIEGMDVVDAFLDVDRAVDPDGYRSIPKTPIVIEKAEVISNGK